MTKSIKQLEWEITPLVQQLFNETGRILGAKNLGDHKGKRT